MRKYSWLYYKIRSTKLFYLYRFILIKKRLPKLFNKHYSDYVFFDNLFDRHSKNFILADKVEVRKILKKRNLKHILPQLYFVYSSAEEIDFDVLPNRFALKCNHGAGFNIICNDKSKLSLQDTKNKLDEWLKKSHPIPFEGHYRRIKPKIFRVIINFIVLTENHILFKYALIELINLKAIDFFMILIGIS